MLNNSWNLPLSTIDNLGLIISDKTFGNSFRNNARCFELPEIGGVYILECDYDGNVRNDSFVTIIFQWHDRIGCQIATHQFLADSKSYFLKWLNSQISHFAKVIL